MTPVISITHPDGDYEIVEFHYDEVLIASANHDEHGWSGMEAVEQAVRTFAHLLDIEVVEQ